MLEYGVTTKEAAEAVAQLARLMPPPNETDIKYIKKNPSLNFFQKRRLIRAIRKAGEEIKKQKEESRAAGNKLTEK